MRTRTHCLSAAIHDLEIGHGNRGAMCWAILLMAVSILAAPRIVFAENVAMESAEAPGVDPGAPPVAQSGNVNFFSQDLGTMLRLRYNTESYGQDGQGNFDVGSMQVFTMEDSAAILDGQVTMNENDGVGFNIGAGYRWMNFPPYSMSSGRVDGVSVWADGMQTRAGNFFPQIGVSYESLGESWDLRSNFYIPLGPKTKVGDFKPTGEIGFQGNSISQLTQAIVDSSFTVGELEVARRLGAGRDAWAFAGPYFLTNDDDDSAGYRVGVRGYAFPDLLVQFAVSDDEIFSTWATFQVQWFVGRTRSNFQSTCGVPDRMREPIMRNDYVALRKSIATGGKALTDADGNALRIVHFDSDAAAGGNGTFEHPYNALDEGNGTGSQEGDILFAHSTSTFDTGITLKNNQRFLGEGNSFEHKVVTQQEGTISIPESSPGARALARPTINVAANSDAIALADSNEVSNFDMNGQNLAGTTAIVGFGVDGAGNANLNHLAISNVTDDAIVITQAVLTDSNDLDNDNNTTEKLVRGNLTVDEVTFTNVGGYGLSYIGTTDDVALPNITLSETLAISNVTSTGGTGVGLNIENTHAGSGNTTTLNNYTYDGSTTSLGGIRLANFDGAFTASNSMLTGGSTAAGSAGVDLEGDSDGTITFNSTVVFNNLDGIAFKIDGDDGGTDKFGGTVTVASAIANDTNRSISIENLATGASVSFNGKVTDSGDGILVNSNTAGSVTFVGDLEMNVDTAGATAVLLTSNGTSNIDFAGDVNINATGDANGFVATGGGSITAPSTVNSISTETGQALKITGMTIAQGDVRFGDVNRTGVGAASSAIELQNNTSTGSGAIIIGNTTDTTGQAGMIASGNADAVVIDNSASVTITGLEINGTTGFSGVRVAKSSTGTQTTNLNDLTITGGDIGLEVAGGGAAAGTLTMTVNDVTINGSLTNGINVDNVDNGSIAFTNTTVDGNNANGTAGGVLITGSNATITFDAASRIREFGGDDLEVSGGTTAISFAGGIVNSSTTNALDTTGRSVNIHGIAGGTVNLTAASTIDDDNSGILVNANNGGTISLSGDNKLTTGAAAALTVTGNTGATVNVSDLTINTTSGSGLVATGGGTLNVLGPTNTITTTTGTGVDIEGMTIGTSSVSLQSVNVNGATNGIVLKSLTGTGDVTIGTTAGAQNSGGSLTTTGDAIVLENTANVTLQHIQVASAGGQGVNIDHTASATTAMDVNITDLNLDASTGTGISVLGASNTHAFNLKMTNNDLEEKVDISITGSGAFGLLVDSNAINTTGTDIAFALSFSGTAQNGDVTFRNSNNFTAVDASALSVSTSGATFKTVDLLVQDSQFSNNSADAAADFLSAGSTQLNATIQGNVFNDVNAGGSDFVMEANGAQAHILMNLGGEVAADFNTAGGQGQYELFQNGGSDFKVFERTNTFANSRNNGTVDQNGGTYTNSATAPPLPTVPSP